MRLVYFPLLRYLHSWHHYLEKWNKQCNIFPNECHTINQEFVQMQRKFHELLKGILLQPLSNVSGWNNIIDNLNSNKSKVNEVGNKKQQLTFIWTYYSFILNKQELMHFDWAIKIACSMVSPWKHCNLFVKQPYLTRKDEVYNHQDDNKITTTNSNKSSSWHPWNFAKQETYIYRLKQRWLPQLHWPLEITCNKIYICHLPAFLSGYCVW